MAKNRPGSGQVRIIAGQWRSRKLPIQDLEGLRPTTDRVRETLLTGWQVNSVAARCWTVSVAVAPWHWKPCPAMPLLPESMSCKNRRSATAAESANPKMRQCRGHQRRCIGRFGAPCRSPFRYRVYRSPFSQGTGRANPNPAGPASMAQPRRPYLSRSGIRIAAVADTG